MSIAFAGSSLPEIRAVTLVTVLAIACVTDLRTRRIPNVVVAVGALAGVSLAFVEAGAGGLAEALGGMITGLIIWMPFWLMRMMGGGDVKLFAAGATWLDPLGAVEAAMVAGLCGGLLAMSYALWRYGLSNTLLRLTHGVQYPQLLRESASEWDRRLPYALAMSAGLAVTAFWRGSLL